MFIQVIQGKVKDPEHLRRQLERWRAELKPGAKGYLGHTGGVTGDGRSIAVVRFESEADANANSERPEQGAWWEEASKAFDGEPEFRNSSEVDLMLGGGSNKAGFVQVIQGKAKDEAELRRLGPSMEGELKKRRPDILGGIVAWHGGGTFTQVVYFQSEAGAREGEKAAQDDELNAQFMSLLDTSSLSFWDLQDPDID